MSDVQMIANQLFERFNKVALSPKETASVIGSSVEALAKDRANATGIPCTRRNNQESGQVMYLIAAIAKTLIKNQTKTI